MADLISMLAAASGIGAEEADPNFKQTVLLLHGDNTNGAQNNTFLDSSTNNFTITRNGNTTQGTFSPFSLAAGEWSNYFDGVDDYLSLGGQSELAFGAGDFCIEFFVYFAGGLGADIVLYDSRPNNTNGAYPTIFVNSSNKVVYVQSSADRITSTTSMAYGSWFHICVSRSGTDTKLFINGTQEGSTYSDSATYLNGANRPTIGTNGFDVTAAELPGYISNLRVVKGSAVRTANFSVPTAPLTAITNTSLLTCQSNRFVDNSSNAFAITRNGDVRVTPFSPFAPSAAYSAGTNGGSGYFDGTGDYLQISNQTALQVGGGAFTAEAWIYPTTFGGAYRAIFGKRSGPSSEWQLSLNNTNNEVLAYITSTTISTGLSALKDQWNHVAMSHDGTNLSIYVNGVRGSNTVTTISNSTAPLRIGAIDPQVGQPIEEYTGYISGFRVVKGTAVYSGATLTVPTAPLTAITNTSLLLNFTNAGIFDQTGKNVLETVGDAQIDTTTKKFGTGSMEFDGTGDWLLLPASPDMAMGTGDFTFECWIYATAASDSPVYDSRSTNSNTNGFTVTAFSSTVIRVYTTAVLVTATVSNYLNTWVHVAFTRSGSTNRLFINGNLENTATASDNFSNQVAIVGGGRYGGGVGSTTITNSFTGFIDDLRITKGVARYTANFTPPTAAFPNE